jgi:hypothetical protein
MATERGISCLPETEKGKNGVAAALSEIGRWDWGEFDLIWFTGMCVMTEPRCEPWAIYSRGGPAITSRLEYHHKRMPST